MVMKGLELEVANLQSEVQELRLINNTLEQQRVRSTAKIVEL